jgi:hypothetical protein
MFIGYGRMGSHILMALNGTKVYFRWLWVVCSGITNGLGFLFETESCHSIGFGITQNIHHKFLNVGIMSGYGR